MTEVQSTLPGAPPSTRQLVKSTLLAALVASGLLITVVFPAEYGRDPTGIGRVLGLTEMGQIKLRLAREAAAGRHAPDQPAAIGSAPAPPPATTAPTASRSDVRSIALQPNEGKELKLAMRQGARVTFSWATDRGVVSYDLHVDGEPPRSTHSYRKGKGAQADEGAFEAAWEGWHGWYWRNRTAEVVTITLRTAGEYQDLKEMR